jgi:hypothetical protein
MKVFYRVVFILGVVFAALLYAHEAFMGLGAVMFIPLGFLFGIGEAANYGTLQERLINLFWHVAPGLAGSGLCGLSLVASGLLLLGSYVLWRRSELIGG